MAAERTRSLLTPLNLHLAGAAALLLLNLLLVARLLLAWQEAQGRPAAQLAGERAQRAALELELAPLNGLPHKVEQARLDGRRFYSSRIPDSYSAIAAEVGELAAANNVRLTRLQYTQAPAIASLQEIRLDSSLSGDYTAIMKFINGLERDRTFFLIHALAFTGQQGGLVNLRLRFATYLRAADAAGLPASGGEDESAGAGSADRAPESSPGS
jgi:hypothetical protein